MPDSTKEPEPGLCERCHKAATRVIPRRTREAHETLGPLLLCEECYRKLYPGRAGHGEENAP